MPILLCTETNVIKFLKDSGICVPDLELVKRVVIDLDVDHPVKVYVEKYGEETVLDVPILDLSRAQVFEVKPKEVTSE